MKHPTALLTCAQMLEADRLTVASGISAFTLMDNAGRAVAQAITARYTPRSVAVLCGPGNNGGDGYVVARYLNQAGWTVRVARLGDAPPGTGEAAQHAALYPGDVVKLTPAALTGAALVVDALFGAGLSRALEGEAAHTLQAAAAHKLPIVAIDVPSGVLGNGGGDSGANIGAAFSASAATLTVTFFRKKPGHVLQPGKALCGEVIVADIGTPESVWDHITPQCFENDPRLWAHARPALHPEANKYTRGHALIVGGYPTTGASRLAARAAARAGAGLTTLAVPEVALAIYAGALTSVMVSVLSNHAGRQDLARLLSDERFKALLIGPGAGVHARTREQVLALLATRRPTVLDADALTVFQTAPNDLFNAIQGPCVLTPHEGEFARIFKSSAADSKLDRALKAAQLSGAVMVLKGSDTVIASTEQSSDPQGAMQTIVNTNAPPTLATAGSGDVLAGMTVGLLTQGMPPFLAAAAAVWMHGAAAAAFGPGLIAEDLPDLLPGVLKGLLRGSEQGQ
jgi:ADP-dependent NAD(P)H-hydrate dehydratase / NAD(P)H-hydrate epimerase